MPTYAVLGNWTEQGVQGLKDLPQRFAAVREATQAGGGDLKGLYVVMGDYDVLAILEAPDDKTMATAMLAQAAGGNVRTKTMRAFTEEEIGEIVAAL